MRCSAVARTPAGTGAAFVLGGVAQLELKHGTVQLWSWAVISGGRQKSLARPDVEVKFPSNLTSNAFRGGTDFGDEAGAVNGWGWGGGLGNCLVYDFR